jgi:hypothetical protein
MTLVHAKLCLVTAMSLIWSAFSQTTINTGFVTFSQFSENNCGGDVVFRQSEQLGLCFSKVNNQNSFKLVASGDSVEGSVMVYEYTGPECAGSPINQNVVKYSWQDGCGTGTTDNIYGQYTFSSTPSCNALPGLQSVGYVTPQSCSSQDVNSMLYCSSFVSGKCFYQSDKYECFGGEVCNQLVLCNTDNSASYKYYQFNSSTYGAGSCPYLPDKEFTVFYPNCDYAPGSSNDPQAVLIYETFSCNSQDSAIVAGVNGNFAPLATQDNLDTTSDVVDGALGVSVINMILLLVLTIVVVFKCRPGGAMSGSSSSS